MRYEFDWVGVGSPSGGVVVVFDSSICIHGFTLTSGLLSLVLSRDPQSLDEQ